MTGYLTFRHDFRCRRPLFGKGRKGSLRGLLTKVVRRYFTLEPSIK